MADASFARPFGVPDGHIGAVLYALIVALLVVHTGERWVSAAALALGVLVVFANFIGVDDMARLGAFCVYCLLTTVASPVLVWALWRLQYAVVCATKPEMGATRAKPA